MDLNILGIGAPELLFFVVILLLLFGPNDLVRIAKDIGKFFNRLTRSEEFQTVQQASQELRNLPQRIAREAQLDDLRQGATIAPPAPPSAGKASAAGVPPSPPGGPFSSYPTANTPPAAGGAVPPVSDPPPAGNPAPGSPLPHDPYQAWTTPLPGAGEPPAAPATADRAAE